MTTHRCDGVLVNGVMQRAEMQASDSAKLVLAARFSRMTYKEAKEKTAAGLRIQYGTFRLGGDYSEDEFDRFKEEVRSTIDVDSIIKHESSVLLSSGDPNILKTWSDCIKSGGLTMYIEPRGDDEAVVNILWTPYPTTQPNLNPTVKQFSVSEGTTVKGGETYARPGAKVGIGAQRIISVTRRSGAAVLAVLSTVETGVGDAEAYLPANVKPGPHTVPQAIELEARQAVRKVNTEVGGDLLEEYGMVLHNAQPYEVDKPNAAEFDFDASVGGRYRLDITYAALTPRPVSIAVNGVVVLESGCGSITGSWVNQQKETQLDDVRLKAGVNTLKLYSEHVFPHISRIRFVPT